MGRLKKRLQKFADQLNKNLPRSEVWFQGLWNKYNFHDMYNKPFGFYIPDVINKRFKYIIEIDGDIHKNPEQIEIDKNKDLFYSKSGYKVFRIEAYNIDQYNNVLSQIKRLRTPPQTKKSKHKKPSKALILMNKNDNKKAIENLRQRQKQFTIDLHIKKYGKRPSNG